MFYKCFTILRLSKGDNYQFSFLSQPVSVSFFEPFVILTFRVSNTKDVFVFSALLFVRFFP